MVESVWLSTDRSRSLSISKYPALLLTGSIFSPSEPGIIGIEKFLIYVMVKLLNWLGEATRIPSQNLLRGCRGGIPKEKERFLLLSETLPEAYLRLRYLHSCWHCCLCGCSCCVLPLPQTVAWAGSCSAKVWTVCNIFSYLISVLRRWCLANQHAHSGKFINMWSDLYKHVVKFAEAAWYRKMHLFFFPVGEVAVASGDYYFKKKNIFLFWCVFSNSSKCLDLRASS